MACYNDPTFYEEINMECLKEKEEFRKTGIAIKATEASNKHIDKYSNDTQ